MSAGTGQPGGKRSSSSGTSTCFIPDRRSFGTGPPSVGGAEWLNGKCGTGADTNACFDRTAEAFTLVCRMSAGAGRPGGERSPGTSTSTCFVPDRRNFRISLPRIGDAFGRDHSTIINSCDKITKQLENQPDMKGAIADLKKIISEK